MADIDLTSDKAQEGLLRNDQLSEVIKDVEDYLDTTDSARALSAKCRDYKDGYQWTDKEIAVLNKRKQPVYTDNRIKSKVQFLLGMENQSRTDPKGLPRNPEDLTSGEVSTDAVRFVHDKNKSDQKFTDGFESMVVEAVEIHDIFVKFVGGKFEIEHEQIPFDRCFFDPHSRKKDFFDAGYLGILEWMDTKDVLDIPGATEEATSFEDDSHHNTFNDKPSHFIDKKSKRVRVFFMNKKIKGVWHWTVFTKGAFIQPLTPSPYLDDNGEPETQFVFQSAFVDRENNRYPEVASYLSHQDSINHRGSKALHLLNVRQTWGDKGAVPDVRKLKMELNKADGHVEIQQGEFEKNFGILDTGVMAQGQIVLLQQSIDALDAQGANASMTGKDERDLSGVAFDKLSKGGLVEVGTLFDNHRYCKLRVWNKFFNRIKQYWTEERWIRVTDDNNAPKFAGLNRNITMGDRLKEKLGEIPEEFLGDPRLDIVVDRENPANKLDVDIVLEESEDIGSMMASDFELLVRMWEKNPDAVPYDFLIEASSLRNKKGLLERIRGGTPEQQKALSQVNQEKKEENEMLIKAAAIALIQKDEATAKNLNAAAAQKAVEAEKTVVEIENVEASTEKLDAETDQTEVETAKVLEEEVQKTTLNISV